jgi:hypothetical protein
MNTAIINFLIMLTPVWLMLAYILVEEFFHDDV